MTISDVRQCLTCQHRYRSTVQHDTPGLLLSLTKTTPSFNHALNSYFQSQIRVNCPQCTANTNQSVDSQIVAAPQILKVAMTIFTQEPYGPKDKNGSRKQRNVKLQHTHQHPDVLDLTTRQMHNSLPLRYRLSSVISHVGDGTTAGHYVASVRGQGGRIQAISDSDTQNFTQAQFLASPQVPSQVWEGNFTVYVLTYLREDGQLTRGQRAAASLVSEML